MIVVKLCKDLPQWGGPSWKARMAAGRWQAPRSHRARQRLCARGGANRSDLRAGLGKPD